MSYFQSSSLQTQVEENNTGQKESKMVWIGPVVAISILLMLGGAIAYSVKKEEEFNLIGGNR